METTVDDYVHRLVAVFEQVHRVLRPRGTVWLNLGDGYASTGRSRANPPGATSMTSANYGRHRRSIGVVAGLAPKNLIGLPWRVAFALRDTGRWWVRNAVVWDKTNGQPSSVRDRLTCGYEFVFLLTRSREYFFDLDAIRVPWQTPPRTRRTVETNGGEATSGRVAGKNPGDVWRMPTRAVREAHFATFPVELPRRCIAAGCPPAGHVLDPFSGTATTGLAALDLGRRYTGIDLNPEYTAIAQRRLSAWLDGPGTGHRD
jgi:site-specific DNA-methyltransferase (cytosine-N4-specific)